jgi:murein DD-endopeptidase MepM/ murein hydrolase activator NlpD
LAAAEAAEAEAERKDVELAGRLVAAQESQAQAEADLAESAEEIEDSEAAIGRLAAEVYRSGNASAEMQVALGSTTPDQFATRVVLADAVMRSRGGTLARLQETKALQSNAETRLEAVQVQVADLRQQAADNLVAAEAARAEAAERKAEVDALIAAQTQAAATIEARKAEETARLAALEAEQTRLEEELRRIAAAERAAAARAGRSGGGSSGDTNGTLQRPVSGPVTSGYGYRIHPIYGTKRLHRGTDFGSPCGTPIRAAEEGRVVSAGWAGGYGNRIVVNHGVLRGVGVATSYNHMSGYKVRSGSVSRGQIIGYIGTTGSSTGCHLHFEVYVNGSTVNPMGWL